MKEFVKKLIGRLEELKTFKLNLADAMSELMKKDRIDNYISKEEVIEIVNQLAEEYNNDVCEWEKGSSGYVGYPAYYSRCCTTNSKGLEMQTHIISDWKFCPYCGKKIKVVE